MIGQVPRIRSSVALNNDGKRHGASAEHDGVIPGADHQHQQERPAKKSKQTHHHLVIKPSDYALAAFRANGVAIEDARTRIVASKLAGTPCTSIDKVNGYTANVLEAIRKGNLAKLKEMDDCKMLNVDACTRWGDSLLHLACRCSQTDIVMFLLNKGAAVDVRDDYHRTPLHDAVWTAEPNFELVDCLLKRGASYQVLMPDVRGFTPFDYVRQEHAGQWLRFLWERKSILTLDQEEGQAK
jgi:hypothetical protein